MATNKQPWVRFFPSDWLAGTRGLSATESGVYISLVCLMYESRAALPRDDTRHARLCGLPLVGYRRALGTLIALGKVMEDDGALWNDRVAVELQNTIEKSEAARQSAEARWSKRPNQNKGDGDANAVRPQSVRNANHNHTIPPKSPRGDFEVIREGDALVPAIEAIRGKRLIFGTKSTATVTRAEYEQAVASLLNPKP